MDIESISHLKSRDSITINCSFCEKEFLTTVKNVRESLKTGKNRYCSTDCMKKSFSESKIDRVEVPCYRCGIPVPRTKSQLEKSNNIFCSKSCAATVNNHSYPKREKVEVLIEVLDKLTLEPKLVKVKKYQSTCECGGTKAHTSKKCFQCKLKEDEEKLCRRTLGEIKELYVKDDKRLGSVSHTIATRVRMYARMLAKFHNREKVCKICGYTTYVELCHIHPISSFPDEATLGEINNDKNTVYLCPNHHKEMDLGLLDNQFV